MNTYPFEQDTALRPEGELAVFLFLLLPPRRLGIPQSRGLLSHRSVADRSAHTRLARSCVAGLLWMARTLCIWRTEDSGTLKIHAAVINDY